MGSLSFPLQNYSYWWMSRSRSSSNCGYTIKISGKAKDNGRLAEKKEQHGIKIKSRSKSKSKNELDSYTCCRLLQSYGIMKSISGGKILHAQMTKIGFATAPFIENTLINMYAKCGFLEDARQVFDTMSEKNIVSWTTMIARYAEKWHGVEALELYGTMLRDGKQVKGNQSTFVSILRACASLACLEYAKQIHPHIIKSGFTSDVTIGNALITMYSKCGSLEDARNVFDNMYERDVVSWSAMISGCAQNGHEAEAQKLFSHMQLAGVASDKYTFATALVLCNGIQGLELGKQVHTHIIKTDFESDSLLESTLATMYAKCNDIENARKLFDNMVDRDMVTWTAMIAGYAHNGQGEEALKLFCHMLRLGSCVDPDIFTFTCVLGVCADLASVNEGKQFHGQIIKRAFHLAISIGSSLINMYSKCSCIVDARAVFDAMPKLDVISWSAMIAGYALHGLGKEAIQLFEKMQCAGIEPDNITFVAVLSACSHTGLVEEGRKYFGCMRQEYGITPSMEHFACMVDLLGRAGLLSEAECIINEMPFEPGALVWGTLLSACRIHGNTKLGKHAAERLLELEPNESAPYVLLSNIYAMESRWDDVAKVRKMMKERRVVKEPGQSWIVVKDRVHAFYAGDTSHAQTKEIYAKLEELYGHMVAAGYVPDTKFVLT